MRILTLGEALRSTSRFLDDYWILKWFVAPILFMGLLLLGLLLTNPNATALEAWQIVLIYLAASFGVILLGLVAEFAIDSLFGIRLFHERGENE